MTGRAIMSGQAIASARVRLAGVPLPDSIRVLSIRISARFGVPTQCEIEVHDRDGHAAWPAPAALGAHLSVGIAGTSESLFEGEVTGVELLRAADGVSTARIRGYDHLHRLRKRQSVRVMESVTAGSLARMLTADLPIDVDDDTVTKLDRVVQHRQNDFDLLVEVAARAGRLVTLAGNTLRLSTLAGHGEPVPLVFGTSLLDASVEASLERLVSSVTASGWDTQTARPVRAVAAQPRQGQRIALTVPKGSEADLVDQPATAEADVAAAAQLALDTRTASGVVLRGVAAGDARLRPGARLDVAGVSPSVDGRHVLCQVVHCLDGNGFQSTFSTEPPTTHPPDRGTAVTLGLVTAVDDPDGRGRVRVRLPTIGDIDAGWLGVVCPGAGRGKGLLALPDVGDTVAVALPHADPTAGLVLGSLYGSLTPPDPGVSGNAVRRWSLRTPGGQSLVLDDAAHSLRLANHDGSSVELSPKRVRVKATTDLVLDAAGHDITIRASKVDFEHAML